MGKRTKQQNDKSWNKTYQQERVKEKIRQTNRKIDILEHFAEEFKHSPNVPLFYKILEEFNKYIECIIHIVYCPYSKRKGAIRQRLLLGMGQWDSERQNIYQHVRYYDIFRFIDEDDIKQQIYLQIIWALRKYASNRKTTFRYYAYTHIALRLGRWLYQQMRKCTPRLRIPLPRKRLCLYMEFDEDVNELILPDTYSYIEYIKKSEDVRLGFNGNMKELLHYTYRTFRDLTVSE